MANRAATDLANLTKATQAAQDQAAQNATLATERGQEGGQLSAQETSSKEAGFALPEALSTAVMGSFILGPVGGLVLGAAQGWLGKREKQNILDQQAKRNEAMSSAEDVLRGQFDDLLSGAKNDEDKATIEGLRTQQDAAFKLMRSGDSKLQEAGMALMQNVQTEANGFAQTQEAQRIEKEVRDAELARTIEEQGVQRFNKLEDDFTSESQMYEDVTGATNLLLQALERGSPADLWAAGILVNKALDPTGIVRQEEAEAVGTLGSLWTKASVMLEKAANGQTILPEERRQLSALATTIQNGATQIQLAREARYKGQLADSNVPQKFWDNFNLTGSVPAYEQGDLQNAAPAFKGSEGEGILNDYLEATRADIMSGAETVGKAFDKGFNAVEAMLKRPNPKPTGQMRRRGVN